MNVPKHFWADVVSTTCFFINRMPSSVFNWATPYHQLFPNNPLFLIEPKVFGCTCFVWDVRPQVSKLDPKSLKCIFLGYSRVKKGYRCYCSTLRRYFVSSLSPTVMSPREDDDLLVYYVSLPVPTRGGNSSGRVGLGSIGSKSSPAKFGMVFWAKNIAVWPGPKSK